MNGLRKIVAKDDEVVGICDRLMDLGVQKVGSVYCSGEEVANIFKEKFGENYIAIAAGKVFEV